MTKKIRKYLEYLFFILINIFIWMPIYLKLLLNSWNIAEYFAVKILHSNLKEITELDDPTGIILLCSIVLTLLLIKPFLFHFIYMLKKIFPNLHKFFDKMRINRKFMCAILILVFLLDSISVFIFKLGYWSFLGLSFNYILFLLFFIPVAKSNTDSNGNIINSQGIFAKIITIITLSLVTILIILVNILPILFFIGTIFDF